MKNYSKLQFEIIEYIQENCESYIGNDVHDLHNYLFNEDYWVIGYLNAELEILKHCSIFQGIQIVKDYELENFGQISTDLSNSEKVANMLVYILGEEILNSCRCMHNTARHIDQDFIDSLIAELANL